MPGSSAHDRQKQEWQKQRILRQQASTDSGRADSLRQGAGGRQDSDGRDRSTPAPRPVGVDSGSIGVDRRGIPVQTTPKADPPIIYSGPPISAINKEGFWDAWQGGNLLMQKISSHATPYVDVAREVWEGETRPPTRWQKFKSYIALGKWALRRKKVSDNPSPPAVVDGLTFDMSRNHQKGVQQAKVGAVAGLTGGNAIVFGVLQWVRSYDAQFWPWPSQADIAVSSAAGTALGGLFSYATGRIANWLKYRAEQRGVK